MPPLPTLPVMPPLPTPPPAPRTPPVAPLTWPPAPGLSPPTPPMAPTSVVDSTQKPLGSLHEKPSGHRLANDGLAHLVTPLW